MAERRRLAEEERLAAARQAREERLDRVVTLLALAQLQEAREESAAPAVVYSPYGGGVIGAPVAVFPGIFLPPRHPPHRPPGRGGDGGGRPPVHPPETTRGVFSYDALAGRQPGSIIPLALDPGAARGQR
jgi:hypothetical protein